MGALVRSLLTVGLLGFVVLVLVRRRRSAGGSIPTIPVLSWPPVPTSGGRQTARPEPTDAAEASGGSRRWVEPQDRSCPATHPIKAKVGSGIYHRPRMAAYNRTIPDRCYASDDDAEADGFRPARR